MNYKLLVIPFTQLCLSYTLFGQKIHADLKEDLAKAVSIKTKADICFDIADNYLSTLKMDSGLYYTNKLGDFSKQSNYEIGMGKYHLATAKALYFRSRTDEGVESALKAIEIFSRKNDILWVGRGYMYLGMNQNTPNSISLSRKSYWMAIHCFESVGSIRGRYSAYRWMAYSYFNKSEVDSASFYQLKALAMAELLNDVEKISNAACWVGSTLFGRGELNKAIRYFDYGLRNIDPNTDKVGLRITLTDFASCLILAHQFVRADSVIKAVENLNTIFNDEYGSVMIHKIRGTAAFERKDYLGAISYLQQASDKMEESKIVNEDTRDVELLLSKALYEAHNYDGAVLILQKTISTARALLDLIAEMDANLLMSKSYEHKGKVDSALVYFRNYVALKDSLLSEQKQKNIVDITTRYETEKKEQEIKILQHENELSAFQLRLKNGEIEKQNLLGIKNSQQVILLMQQNEINRLQASEKEVIFQKQGKEILAKQNELTLLGKEKEFQALLVIKQNRQKNLAFLSGAIILLLGVYVFYRAIQHKNLNKKLVTSLSELKRAEVQLIKSEREKEAENIRSSISRDIHDEVGATLSGVALYSQIAKQKMEQHEEKDAHLYLDQISINAKEMVEKMGDLVWAINPENDSIDRIITKLKSYAINLCGGRGIKIHFHIDEKIKQYLPSMQIRKNIYLLSKEAINNAVKYSECRNIYYEVRKEENYFFLIIKDDGKGFDVNLIDRGNGLNNMQTRAREINALLKIQSQPGEGTSIILKYVYPTILENEFSI